MTVPEAVIVAVARSPIGRAGKGSLVEMRPDDLAAQMIAREIAKQIEDELSYPGQIRVTVIRESRSSEIAH